MALGRLQQRTTPDTVADRLREAILKGSLPAGSQLLETRIASELGISRAPLREALRRLEEEGLVVKIPFRGAYVAEVSRRSIEEIAVLRSVLEPWAIEQGLQTLQGEQLPQLRVLVSRLAAASRTRDVAESVSADLAFHRTIYESVGNEALASLWHGWENQLRLFLAADYQAGADSMSVHLDHAAILDMIETGDLAGLQKAFAIHVPDARAARSDRAPSSLARARRRRTAPSGP